MTAQRLRGTFTLIGVLGAAAAFAVVKGSVARAQTNSGKTAYDRVCAGCHGSDARGSLGPSLVPFGRTDQELLALVRGGGSQMRPLSNRDISDAEVAGVARYLTSLAPVPSRPDSPSAADGLRPITAPRPELFNAAEPAALSDVTDEMLAKPKPGDWLSWRRTLDGWGYSPLDQINKNNVRTLQLAWSWGLDPGPSQTTPLVHDGVMYIANPGNVVDALDARTGQLLWEYRRPMDERRRLAAQTRSLAITHDTVILGTVDAHLVALDARRGSVRWDTNVGGSVEAGFTFTSGPIVADGAVVAGLTGCNRFDDETCYIVAVDGRTGRLLWKTSTLARPGEPGGDTWGGLPVTFRAGGDAWIPGSYDPDTKVIYWGTAQAKPWAQNVRGTDGDALYTNSTLALDPATGKIKWHFQHLPGESFDMDETFERILIDHDGRSSVYTMGKLGILWELDRRTGAFVRATDTGYQTLVDVNARTGKATYRPGRLQRIGESITFCPSTGGFKSLRAMAYHPATQALYVPLNLNCETAIFEQMERREGGGGVGPVRVQGYQFHPKSPDGMGELQAMDVRTGKSLWQQRRRAPYNTATLTTGGGLVFVGAWDRMVFAYDATTGTALWQSRLPTMANGFPITYAVDGKQYVAIGAGATITGSSWANRVPNELLKEMRNPSAGNGIFVFALPEDGR
jgi:alcohol dehydrogenase (cytochrome c)